MEPVLAAEPYGISVQPAPVAGAFATVAEAEGLTVIALQSVLAAGVPAWARISLTLHSDLAAVGLTAAFAAALAARGISANVVAGVFHDHIFVPWDAARGRDGGAARVGPRCLRRRFTAI